MVKSGRNRQAVPYNTYVQRERQQRFYDRHKTHARFKRLQRHEEREGTGSTALLERVMKEGAEEVDADYERRLELTGLGTTGVAGPSAAKAQKSKAAKRTPESQETSRPSGKAVKAVKKKLKGKEEDPKMQQKAKAKAAPSHRFQRELKAYEEAQAAKAAAIQQREEEKRARNRKKKQTAKERAKTGHLLAKRNMKGQPSMRNLLEMVTSKLQSESAELRGGGNIKAPHKARGFGRRPRGS